MGGDPITRFSLVMSVLCTLKLSTRAQLGYTAKAFMSHKVFLTLFYRSQFPHKSVNLFFISKVVNDELTDLLESGLWKNTSINTFCEISFGRE